MKNVVICILLVVCAGLFTTEAFGGGWWEPKCVGGTLQKTTGGGKLLFHCRVYDGKVWLYKKGSCNFPATYLIKRTKFGYNYHCTDPGTKSLSIPFYCTGAYKEVKIASTKKKTCRSNAKFPKYKQNKPIFFP